MSNDEPTPRHDTADAIRRSRALGEANLAAWRNKRSADPAGVVVLEQLRVAVMRADLYAAMHDWPHSYTEATKHIAALETHWRCRAIRFAEAALDLKITEKDVQRVIDVASACGKTFLAALSSLPDDEEPPDTGVPAKTP